MKNRLILVTSPLQVLNAKAAISSLDYKEESLFNNYVISIHPNLNKNSITTISYYCKSFNFEFLDLSQIFPKEFKQSLLKKKLFSKIKNLKNNYLFNNFQKPKKINKIKKIEIAFRYCRRSFFKK